jgi:hypothetical protein
VLRTDKSQTLIEASSSVIEALVGDREPFCFLGKKLRALWTEEFGVHVI